MNNVQANSTPLLRVVDWNCLNVEDKDSAQPHTQGWEVLSDEEPKFKSAFMPLGVKKTDMQPLFLKGPHTAIEGYMLLRGPIENKTPPKPGS